MAVVNDEIVEIRLESVRRPAFVYRPIAGSILDCETAYGPSHGVDAVDQDIALFGHGRLHDGAARPLVSPQHLTAGRREAGRTVSPQHHDLRNAIDRHQMRRAVAKAAGGADPALLSVRDVVRH